MMLSSSGLLVKLFKVKDKTELSLLTERLVEIILKNKLPCSFKNPYYNLDEVLK